MTGGRVALAAVSGSVLDPALHLAAVDDPHAGATVLFTGVVRDHDGGRAVRLLEYEAHPSAATVVAGIAADVAALDGVVAVAVTHRFGRLAVGDTAVVAAVSAAHRAEAFAACSQLVDTVKHRIPVWKRQEFADGSDEWVGSA
ncbi:molybdenum cofactor biosynthesis protein MoaE [Nakamurella endophytica]|uniref:Molybdenum cofactor biosynthesis protein MoaE n=1 Tax=Nakamurella endophytica TaxID=1748367 RepID=A0A917WAK8_9ACTN|nr:molybdenum cofactor biosynthesis protein MoaE [Nakamurella endophytica]GGL88937.1 hypothetical protein GCM10011594_05760 [Nakamurella endophytica]